MSLVLHITENEWHVLILRKFSQKHPKNIELQKTNIMKKDWIENLTLFHPTLAYLTSLTCFTWTFADHPEKKMCRIACFGRLFYSGLSWLDIYLFKHRLHTHAVPSSDIYQHFGWASVLVAHLTYPTAQNVKPCTIQKRVPFLPFHSLTPDIRSLSNSHSLNNISGTNIFSISVLHLQLTAHIALVFTLAFIEFHYWIHIFCMPRESGPYL